MAEPETLLSGNGISLCLQKKIARENDAG